MSSEVAIRLRGLTKSYRLYERPLDRVLQSLFRSGGERFREVAALNGLDLDVYRGETVGVIGRNGSGKSTLLQIVCGTLYPSGGSVETRGRVAALLELGAGFNPEFSGRENAYLNASIMGLSRQEIEARFADIVEFSGIGEFIDQPVKTYSSGMFVRLAFAVAIHMDPEILIVDEALSVGDVRFQNKCFRKLRELREKGTTVLFVTHSVELVRRHCDRALLLDGGRVMMLGKPAEVVQEYMNLLFGSDSCHAGGGEAGSAELAYEADGLVADRNLDGCSLRPAYNESEYRWGDRRARIQDYLVRVNGEPCTGTCRTGDRIEVLVRIVYDQAVMAPIHGLTVRTSDGITVYGANTRDRAVDVPVGLPGSETLMHYAFDIDLVSGDYFLTLGLAEEDELKDSVAVDRRYDLIHLYVRSERLDFGIAAFDMAIRAEGRPAVADHG